MKKILLKVTILTTIGFASCGESENTETEGTKEKEEQGVTACDCMEISMSMLEEMEDAGMDPDKVQEVEEKYESEIKECEEFGESLSDEEKEEMIKDLEENCESYKKMMGDH